MAYKGLGDMGEFVASWNIVLGALMDLSVFQFQSMGNPAALTYSGDALTLDFT